jgi:hypothetical protein
MQITDAHIHVQPFHMMPPPIAATFWKGKTNREELEGYAANPRTLLARMDADGIARVGLINYVSPDLMGFTDEANPWMIRYASADPSRLIAFGPVHCRFSADVAGETARVIERGAKALKVHPPPDAARERVPGCAAGARGPVSRRAGCRRPGDAQNSQVKTQRDLGFFGVDVGFLPWVFWALGIGR